MGDSAKFDFTPWTDAVDLIYVDGAHSDDYCRLSPGVSRVLGAMSSER